MYYSEGTSHQGLQQVYCSHFFFFFDVFLKIMLWFGHCHWAEHEKPDSLHCRRLNYVVLSFGPKKVIWQSLGKDLFRKKK